MIKSIKAILAQDKEKFKVPRKVQDLIPIKNIWPDGIFKVGNKFSKSFRFSDINYLVASREDKESMFLTYSELLNSLDSGATTKITINNHRLNRSDFEESILMPMKQDGLDEYRTECNVEESVMQRIDIERVRTALKMLAPEERAIIQDFFFTESPIPVKELVEKYAMPKTSIYRKRDDALKKLKKILGNA